MIPVLSFTPFLVIACQSEPVEPVDKNVVLTTPKHASSSEGDFDKMSFQCCDSEEATTLVRKYLSLTKAMAADDDEGTKRSVTELIEYTQNDSFGQDSMLTPFVQALPQWKNLDRKNIQQEFSDPSAAVINYAKAHKADSGVTIIVALCPMAPGGSGRWLQTEKSISNPYYGSEMLTCGFFEE